MFLKKGGRILSKLAKKWCGSRAAAGSAPITDNHLINNERIINVLRFGERRERR